MIRMRSACRSTTIATLVTAAWLSAVPASAQVDFSGMWATRHHEDSQERGQGGELGDYLGLPLNDAARMRADTWDAALYGLPEWQCRPHGTDYMWRSVHPVRITKEVDPVTGRTIAFHANFQDLLDRVIYLDGRPHPSADAPHTWGGFSTGRWEGDMLTVTVSHLKEYILRRDGPPRSDLATMTEHWFRHDDVLTIAQIIYDPIYLTEPLVLTTDFQLDPHLQDSPELCEVNEETDHPRGWVPHRLPGTMSDVEDFAKKYGIPVEAARGGAETMYPAFRKRMMGSAGSDPAAPPARARTASATTTVPSEVRTLKVRDHVYMLTGAGGNVTVLTFPQGVLLVDTGAAAMTDQLLAAVRALSDQPIVHILNTEFHPDHTGGNAALAATGRHLPRDIMSADTTASGDGPTIVAHENVATRMSAPPAGQPAAPERAWPTETYHVGYLKLSAHFHGGEAIELFHEPAAHTDGDSVIQLRHADVIATGDIFTTTGYPMIDIAAGGTIDGELDALNHILDLAFADYRSEGGTMVVPGHGRLADMADVGYYRDMVTVIRDRVRALKARGFTLDQVKAAKPTSDYDPRWGSTTGLWTTDMFVEAVYTTLDAKRP
jgi:cyclase